MGEIENIKTPVWDVKLEELSKDFNVRLLREYASLYHIFDEIHREHFEKLHSPEEVNEAELKVWYWLDDHFARRIAKAANIEVKNLVDVMKILQLVPTGFLSGIHQPDIEIKDENHIILTIKRCYTLLWFEKYAPYRIYN